MQIALGSLWLQQTLKVTYFSLQYFTGIVCLETLAICSVEESEQWKSKHFKIFLLLLRRSLASLENALLLYSNTWLLCVKLDSVNYLYMILLNFVC